MRVELNKATDKTRLSDVQLGDVFTWGAGHAWYMKIHGGYFCINCDGDFYLHFQSEKAIVASIGSRQIEILATADNVKMVLNPRD